MMEGYSLCVLLRRGSELHAARMQAFGKESEKPIYSSFASQSEREPA